MGERKYIQGVHDDPFTFMIDEISPSGGLIEHKGGANNAFAAKAAYLSYVAQYGQNSIIQLRTRARIISQSNQK